MKREIAGHILCSNWIPTKLDENSIVEILQLEKVETCTFHEGLFRVHTNCRSENPNSLLVSPAIHDWRLIMGCQLLYPLLSKEITEDLSRIEKRSFSFGVDIWCGYYSWMVSEEGKLRRYYHFSDGEIEEKGNPCDYDDLIEETKHEECVFRLSKTFGLDMDEIEENDLYRNATLYVFNKEIGWLE